MKKIFTLILCCIFSTVLLAQTTTKTIQHGGITRSYIQHVPSLYNPTEAVPLLICLHGLGDNMSNFTGVGFHQLANSQKFIVLTPQAVNSPFGAAWNSGAGYMGYQLNGTIDDVGFITKLIDTTMAQYNIDYGRVYAMGFSMGGFMCHRLACELNTRIAAIASVAGTMGSMLTCNPNRAVPVLHMHGTGDSTVYYNGNMYGMDAMDAVMFWVNNNNCDTTPVINDVPDIVQDGFTIKHFVFGNGDAGTVVEHYRVDSADHQWIYPPYNDMSYTPTIWDFLKQYALPQGMGIVEGISHPAFIVHPNPAQNFVRIACESLKSPVVEIFDMRGVCVHKQVNYVSGEVLDISLLSSGVYMVVLTAFDNRTPANVLKLIKQ